MTFLFFSVTDTIHVALHGKIISRKTFDTVTQFLQLEEIEYYRNRGEAEQSFDLLLQQMYEIYLN